jgi:hypothetical protein
LEFPFFFFLKKIYIFILPMSIKNFISRPKSVFLSLQSID